jgi:hypothetical protein
MPEALLKDQTVPWQTIKADAAGQTYETHRWTLSPVDTALDQGQQALRLEVFDLKQAMTKRNLTGAPDNREVARQLAKWRKALA